MNDILPTPINEKKITKTISIIILLFTLLPTVLNITCLTPIYFNLENNALYSGTAITLTLKYISDLLDLISFASIYAVVFFSLTLLNKKRTVLIILSYFALLIFKIPARLFMNIPLYGALGTTEEIIADLIYLAFYFFLESLQFTVVLILASVCIRSFHRSISLITEKNKKQKSKKNIEHILPIKKFINWYNPLLRAAIYSSITIIAFKAFARLITDIDAGLPNSFGEVMIIIVNYLTDIVYGIAAYIIAILIFNILFDMLTKQPKNSSNEKENKADEEHSSALFED